MAKRQVSDRTFVTEFPQSRTTIVETFADDGTYVGIMHDGYDVRVRSIASLLETGEDVRGSLMDTDRMTPSPANTDTPLLRRGESHAANRIDLRIPGIEMTTAIGRSDGELISGND
jgi:hypothetical protein